MRCHHSEVQRWPALMMTRWTIKVPPSPNWSATTMVHRVLVEPVTCEVTARSIYSRFGHSAGAMPPIKNSEPGSAPLGWCYHHMVQGCKEAIMFFERCTSPQATSDAQGRKVPVVEVTVAAWSSQEDLLDFHEVPTEAEAVFRLNRAGFFVLTPTGEIYQKEQDGGISHLKKWHFDLFFDNRRCGKRRISAAAAWKRSDRRCQYGSIGYWPDNHDHPPRSYNLWPARGLEPIPGDWSPNLHL